MLITGVLNWDNFKIREMEESYLLQPTDDNEENIPQEVESIFDDSDTLEPFEDETESRVINPNDDADLIYWAAQFQISVADLKAAIVLNGNSLKAIKKYLSV